MKNLSLLEVLISTVTLSFLFIRMLVHTVIIQ